MFAPIGEEVGKMKLEQSKQERAVYSKQESSWKNEDGAKRAGKGCLLQTGK